MTDVTVYTEASAAFLDGRPPYEVMNPRGWRYLYPPLFALLIAPLTWFDTRSQVGFWFAISCVCSFGCFFEIRSLYRSLTSRKEPQCAPQGSILRSAAFWIGVAAALVVLPPMVRDLQRGQLGMLLLYLLLLGLRLVLTSRAAGTTWLGGIVLALPVVFKVYPIVPVAGLALALWSAVARSTTRRTALAAASRLTGGLALGAMLFVFVIPSFMIGWRANLHHLSTWASIVPIATERNERMHIYPTTPNNQSLRNAAYWLKASIEGKRRAFLGRAERELARDKALNQFANAARWVALGLFAMCCVSLARRDDRLSIATLFGLACTLSLIISPIAWTHYHSLLLPTSVFTPLWFLGRQRATLAVLFAASLVVLTWLHQLAYPWAAKLGVLGVGLAAWYVLAAIMMTIVANRCRIGPERTSLKASIPAPHFSLLGDRVTLTQARPHSR
jgi:hypothetical protein